MTTQQVDGLNIGLIIVCLILAYMFPLEVFMLSFAILGPLHYLTEINWLDKKNYFTEFKRRYWLWIGLIAAILIIFPKFYFFINTDFESSLAQFVIAFNGWTNGIIFLVLVAAIAFVSTPSRYWRIGIIALGILSAFFLKTNSTYNTWVGLFIPTVIHVYLFTLLFMLYGAKKSKSKLGYVAFGLALIAPMFIAQVNLEEVVYVFPDTMKDNYLVQNFHVAPVLVGKTLGLSEGTSFFFYEQLELRLMMFFSFIYLYHYLNWFSKTSLIQWHTYLTTKNTIAIAVLWIAMVLLFYYNIQLGFIVGLFFSFLHVLLEFPLNVLSAKSLITSKS